MINDLRVELNTVRNSSIHSSSLGTFNHQSRPGSPTAESWASVVSQRSSSPLSSEIEAARAVFIAPEHRTKPAPLPHPKVDFYRRFTQRETQHQTVLIYTVGIMSVPYSTIKKNMATCGIPISEIYNISKISQTVHEFAVNITYAGFIAKKFHSLGLRLLERFQMDGPSCTAAQLNRNAKRLYKIHSTTPNHNAHDFFLAWHNHLIDSHTEIFEDPDTVDPKKSAAEPPVSMTILTAQTTPFNDL
jgi:hypothetical protein